MNHQQFGKTVTEMQHVIREHARICLNCFEMQYQKDGNPWCWHYRMLVREDFNCRHFKRKEVQQ